MRLVSLRAAWLGLVLTAAPGIAAPAVLDASRLQRHGARLAILWDRDGKRYGRGAG